MVSRSDLSNALTVKLNIAPDHGTVERPPFIRQCAMIQFHRDRRRGFTLVELLVVIAIIGVLVALLLPAVQAAREAARRMQCANNLKQVGLGLISYADAKKKLPAATQFNPRKVSTTFPPAPTNGPGGTWVLEILPFVEQQAVYARFDRTKAPNHKDNAAVVAVPLPFLVCPSSADEGTPDITPLGGGVFDTDDKQDGGSNVNPNRATSGGLAERVMGLWYPVSAGPTSFDGCPFCPAVAPPTPNFCCQGAGLGSDQINASNDPLGPPGTPAPSFAGMFGRYEKGIKLSEVTDGLSSTVMAGETIAVQCKYQCAHCPNFPIAMTNTPLNTFVRTSKKLSTGACVVSIKNDPDEGGYCEACGYKSRHPAGAHLLFGDGHVPFVSESIDFNVYFLLGAKSSGEPHQAP